METKSRKARMTLVETRIRKLEQRVKLLEHPKPPKPKMPENVVHKGGNPNPMSKGKAWWKIW